MAVLVSSTLMSPIVNRSTLLSSSVVIVTPKPCNFHVSKTGVRFSNYSTKVSNSNAQSSDGTEQNRVQELRVPNHWLDPSKAAQVFVFLLESQNYMSFWYDFSIVSGTCVFYITGLEHETLLILKWTQTTNLVSFWYDYYRSLLLLIMWWVVRKW